MEVDGMAPVKTMFLYKQVVFHFHMSVSRIQNHFMKTNSLDSPFLTFRQPNLRCGRWKQKPYVKRLSLGLQPPPEKVVGVRFWGLTTF